MNVVERDPQTAHLVLCEYARCTSTMASLNTMRANLAKRGDTHSKDTFNGYVTTLRKVFAIEDLGPWAPLPIMLSHG